jgi:hypothetical protein
MVEAPGVSSLSAAISFVALGGRTTGRSRVSLGSRKALAVGMNFQGNVYKYLSIQI